MRRSSNTHTLDARTGPCTSPLVQRLSTVDRKKEPTVTNCKPNVRAKLSQKTNQEKNMNVAIAKAVPIEHSS